MKPTQKKRSMSFFSGAFLMLASIAIPGLAAYFLPIGTNNGNPQEHVITIRARQYAYNPPVIRVKRNDTLRLRFVSEDVMHGFYLEGHDLDVKIKPKSKTVEVHKPSDPTYVEEAEEVIVRLPHSGKYRYRCSSTCGVMHPFMLGELVVGPNRLFHAGVGMAMGLMLGGFLFVRNKEKD